MSARLIPALVALSAVALAQEPLRKTSIPFNEVRPLWEALRSHAPAELADRSLAELASSAWETWARDHDARIRSRVARGDEDSLVNLWLFGTSFTDRPPARTRDVELSGDGATLAQVADGRLRDLLNALASPGRNDRLVWASRFFRERGIDPATSRGQSSVRELLMHAGGRMLTENAAYTGALAQPNTGGDPLSWMLPYATLYHDRGLSSDTSILPSFAVDRALEALSASGLVRPASIRRVAVVGPGLDFMNKADGHDFYPEQTIQPFAVVDSLIRYNLAREGAVAVTTFDVSSRVNEHLAGARARARDGRAYVLQLALGDEERWTPELVGYWRQAGDRVGESVPAAVPSPTARNVMVRGVRIHPAVVASVVPRDLNVVIERLEPLPDAELFDLVVATNVFVYYDTFEQALALLNISRMLRSGGSLLSNQAVVPVGPLDASVGHDRVAYSDRQFDYVFWYRRR